MKYIIFTLLLCTSAFATLNNVDRAFLVTKNELGNPGFENGKSFWSVSTGSFSVVTSGSNLLFGGASITWDATASSQTLSSTLTTIKNGSAGRPGVGYCTIMVPSGTATHTISVVDGSANTLGSQSIISNSNPVKSYVNFQYPASGTQIKLVLTSQADEPSITIDDCYLGPADGVMLTAAKTQDVFSAQINNAGTVSSENVDWINGNASIASTSVYTVTFNTGIFSVAPNCTLVTAEAGNANVTINSVSSTQVVYRTFASTSGANTALAASIKCQKASVDAPSAAYKPDTVANYWSGYHDNDCSWARTNTAFGDPTADATCTFTELTNKNFGTVSSNTSAGNKLPGIVFTPKMAGSYEVCANFRLSPGTSTVMKAAILDDSTIINTISTNGAGTADSVSLCGIVTASSTSSKTVTIQTAIASGAVTIDGVSPAWSVGWAIRNITQGSPTPLLANTVVSPSAGIVKVAAASVSSADVVSNETGDWINGNCTNATTGLATCVFNSGIFSATPVCSVVSTSVNASGTSPFQCEVDGTNTSSSQVQVSCKQASSAVDTPFNLICVGVP